MKQKLLLIASLFFLSSTAFAQSPTRVTGQIKDNTGKAIGTATILLHNAKDSSIAKTAISDSKGNYEMQVKPGRYFVTSSVVNMQKTSSPAFEIKEGETTTAPDINTQASAKSLEGVTVSSKKPMVEVKADKTILNVEGTINAVGNDGLELLRKSPGVMVDKDDNLSLAGKNGVRVYIDGKPSPLSGSDLANYLKSLQSAQIESIEIITNPSAKYEAAGNAGIINIRLKKNLTIGTNGSVNAGYNIGIYAKYNAGFSLNHRNTKTNIFGNYNFSESMNEFSIKSVRTAPDTTFDQSNTITNHNKGSHNFKAGMDYFINKKSTIGVVVNGNISDNRAYTEGPMKFYFTPTYVLDRTSYGTGDNKMKRSNVNFNGNYRYAVTGGSELNLDIDYGIFNLRNNQYQPNDYYNSAGVKIYNSSNHTISPTDIRIYSLKVDYEQNFMKGRLGYGGKIGFVDTDNDFNRTSIEGNKTTNEKNNFTFNENINAAYVNYNRAFKGFMIQAGVRVENTNSKGHSVGTTTSGNFDSTVKRNYVDVFPSAAITFNKNPMSQWGFTYSRRIDRPAYQDLNPFEFRLNDYTYMKGNTQLRPQYTNSYGITHTYKYKLNTRLNYSYVKDIFAQLPDTLGSKSLLTKKNLATQDIISLNISYPFQYKWYSFFANVNASWSNYKADFGGGARVVNLEVYTLSFFMQNSFKLGKGYTAEVSGFYNSPSIWQGSFKSKAIYNIDAGVQKTLFKGRGTVKVSVSDVFNVLKFRGTSDFSGQHNTFYGKPESRQFKISFNMRFGRTQIKAARQRRSGIEDENKRTESSGGIGGN
ncbi:MAG TPA: TonB-dependent receptor [Ferruginibacter sp.]|nr:TonB-dependent receptor [Chitinophagaceae bacterium]HRI24161.1 TonB-dependent receptor [Ferruginibacter sp.]